MKKVWCGLMLGAIAVGAVTGGLIKVYSSDPAVRVKFYSGPGDNSQTLARESASEPAFQSWKQIWESNMPAPDLVSSSRSNSLSPIESRLEQIMQKLERIENRLDALQKGREEAVFRVEGVISP